MMKRKSIIALAILAAGSLCLLAQTPCASENCQQTQCQQGQCQQACIHGAPQSQVAPRHTNPRNADHFAGIELTEQQQAAIDSLHPRNQARQNRQIRRQARRDYINSVKQILTPEQYVIFLENIASAPQGQQRPNCQGHHMRRPQPQK